MDLKRGPEQSV